MSTVKISELPLIDHYSTNTEATLVVGVDLSTGTTGKSTLTTLGEGLYANQPLKVGQNQVLFANTIGQFSGNSVTFLQINNQNFNANGSSDYVASTSDSDNLSKYIDVGINGSDFSDPIYSSMKPYDGYLYVYGASNTSTSGNLVVGTASSFANIVYIVGGTTTSNIVARMTKTDLQLSANYNLKFGDGSIQYVAASPANYSQAAYAQANVTIGVDATQNTAISSTDGKMQSAYNKANNALANTSGTFAGDLTVTGNLIANSISTTKLVSFVSSTTPATNALVELIGSSSGLQQTPSNDGYMLHITGKDDVPTRIVYDAFGANSYPLIAGRKGRGAAGTPTATANGDILLRISSNGWGTTGFAPLGSGRIDFVATENYTDASRGSKILFYNVINGTNTINQIASFNAESIEFTGVLHPEKGFILTPNVISSNVTTHTINFATDSLKKLQINADCTVTLTNYTNGKLVEVWVTNFSALTRTFTHGCSALNSTTNATTVSIPATSSAYLKYFSIDGDNANTFVAITHA